MHDTYRGAFAALADAMEAHDARQFGHAIAALTGLPDEREHAKLREWMHEQHTRHVECVQVMYDWDDDALTNLSTSGWRPVDARREDVAVLGATHVPYADQDVLASDAERVVTVSAWAARRVALRVYFTRDAA